MIKMFDAELMCLRREKFRLEIELTKALFMYSPDAV